MRQERASSSRCGLRPPRSRMASAEHQNLDTQPNLVALGLALVMPTAALLSGASWPQLSRGAEVLLFSCLGVCAQMQWATPNAVELVLLALVTAAAAVSAASWRREPRHGERLSLPAASQPSAEQPQTHEIGVQCRLVGAAGVGGDASATAAATTTATTAMTATTAVTEEEAGAKAEAEAEVESEALREREAIHELRVLLESDGVLLPPRYDDEELLRFLQTPRPPLLAAAAVGPVADDIRWRAARGGDAGAPRGACRSGTVASPPPLGAGVLGLCGADRQGRPCLLLRVRHVLPPSVSGGGGRATTSPSSPAADADAADADADVAAGLPGAAGAPDAPGALGAPGPVAGVDAPSAADGASTPLALGAAAAAAEVGEVGEPEDARVLALQEALVTLLDQHCERGGPQALALLLDMRGVELSAAARASPCLNAARDLLQLMRAHYPQRAGSIHVVHLLPVMRWVLAGACALLDSRTAKKVVVHADLASLQQHFAPSALLLEYGGEAASLGGMQSDLEAAGVAEAASGSPSEGEARPGSGVLGLLRRGAEEQDHREAPPAPPGSARRRGVSGSGVAETGVR